MNKVLIIDTSILCVWLNVPGKDSCGPDDDKWDKQRVENKIGIESQNGSTFVLPIATIIETGNHIAQAPQYRRERGFSLAALISKSADNETPWAAFSDQSILWSTAKMKALASAWPDLALQKLSLGDATIKDVAEYYAESGYIVEILTGDQGLKAYQPAVPTEIPRRRQR